MPEIIISKDNTGRINVAFPYNPSYVAKIKTIPSHRWHPKEKYWSFPDTDGTLEKILNTFEGEEIHIETLPCRGLSQIYGQSEAKS